MGNHAQNQIDGDPGTPVRIVVAFTAGGSTNRMLRGLDQQLANKFKHDLVVDNRPGCAGVCRWSGYSHS